MLAVHDILIPSHICLEPAAVKAKSGEASCRNEGTSRLVTVKTGVAKELPTRTLTGSTSVLPLSPATSTSARPSVSAVSRKINLVQSADVDETKLAILESIRTLVTRMEVQVSQFGDQLMSALLGSPFFSLLKLYSSSLK
ncbi:hypothetical protein FALBO_10455 [Fusarium albosuccineum]|uniref:Uncharacterized protein n=1 Tax=Fusarium albosuccineum TaxID=1237068 RepID=A0A8H4L5Z1_9HYPO|nr:hypothetical protein FALBO_10455 [Fusarium albosuccineum]